MKQIKIVRIITRLNIGGPAQHVLLLTRHMQSESFETKLITGSCEKDEGDMSYLAEELGVKPTMVSEMSRKINPFRDTLAFFKIYNILRMEKPDIVHTHTAKAGTLGRLASLFAVRAIRVHTFHGHSLEGYFNKAKSLFFSLIEKALSMFTDRIIVLNEDQKTALSGRYRIARPEKFSVIELGLGLDRFLQIGQNRYGRFRKENNIAENTVLVGIIGRLVEIKNHRMFLEAVHNIRSVARNKGYRFIIVGDGELQGSLVDYAKKLDIYDIVRFTGWLKDIYDVYEAVDIVSLTSVNEGTPVCLIQALASSKPVIATDVGGVRSVVTDGKNGYLVRPNDVVAFADRMLELASDPEKRIRFGEFGREYVKDRFSDSRLVKDLEALYLDLMAKKRN
ncbi:MAG: hypothetical protein A2Z72_02890 [Omnitrophica bacterium RBG_13_46_9]|nr:MAG: hypothetical protein A2Z72_02890 [Omnitrophica bacterium RBG_13_46_9]